ncbi:MAG: sulfide/dihydroorotate dehydrogenase-like FAD/NAD-binding protein [Candidatus Omnitrophota bacterium]|nr:MAG: sulfide/dihydroorotate dehydrogenase-like FAD/NAD-binding protein [Candidatus Omnitrophota bacterium]
MKIVKKVVLTRIRDTRITKIEMHAPLIAVKAKAGQFVVLMVEEKGERIPLTVVDTDKDRGTITLIFQELGLTTKLLGKLNAGDTLYALVGPMGHSTEIKNYGKVILIGGGVGIAEIYPVAKAFKDAGNHIITIIGARTKGLLILEDELKTISDELHVVTDDGSYGKKGFTTDILKDIVRGSTSSGGRTSNNVLVYAVGPIPMMKRVSSITKDFNIKTLVSLNALMVDASGMCGCCRVSINNEVKFSCVDGPEFDAHSVDWEELEKRNKIYEEKEKHICKLSTK